MAKTKEVRKRDSRIVPFDETKIADAIYRAVRSAGEGDRTLADELAQAVSHFLDEKFAGSIPGIEDIQDVVETVLVETGHAGIAKAYILYRQKRAVLRDTLQVRKVSSQGAGDGSAEDESGSATPLPEVDESQGSSRWQKGKITAALIREADLDPTLADEIASQVEKKVLDSGLKRLSTSLVRELVDNELFERGFSAKLRKQAPIGIPKYNLEQIIFGTDVKEGYAFPKTPVEIRNIIANRVLHQYSLEEVFTPGVADAHSDGRIFIHRLSDPIRLSRLMWAVPPSPDAQDAGGAAPHSERGDFFRRLWHLAHFFSEEVRLCRLPEWLGGRAVRPVPLDEAVRAVLERLSQMEARPDIALEFDLAPQTLPWLKALRELTALHPQRFLLAFRVSAQTARTGDAVLQAVAELYARGERVEFLPSLRGSPVEEPRETARRRGPLRANAAKITINLPRAAFRSARDRRNSLEAEIEDVLDLAIKGHLERRRFVEMLAANRENPLWALLGESESGVGDMEFSIGILGLNECIKFLTGNELHQDSEAARLGLDLVRGIHRKLRREERSLGIRLVLEETANIGPLRALERADKRKCPQMAEIERGRNPEWGVSYTNGVRFHRMAPVDPLRRVEELAAYVRFLEPAGGFVEDFPELRTSARELLVSLLEECIPLVGAAEPRGAPGSPLAQTSQVSGAGEGETVNPENPHPGSGGYWSRSEVN